MCKGEDCLTYYKTIIRFGFCDIQNNQGLGKGYQPQPSALAHNPYLDLDFFWISQKPHPIIVIICWKTIVKRYDFYSLNLSKISSGDLGWSSHTVIIA